MLAQPGPPERCLPHLRGQAGPEAVPGQEVVEGGVGQLPAVRTVHRVIFEPGGRMLPPCDQRISRVVGGVGAEAAEHRLGQLRARRADGQHHGRLLLAGGQRDNLEHVGIDPAGLIDQGEGVVQSL